VAKNNLAFIIALCNSRLQIYYFVRANMQNAIFYFAKNIQ